MTRTLPDTRPAGTRPRTAATRRRTDIQASRIREMCAAMRGANLALELALTRLSETAERTAKTLADLAVVIGRKGHDDGDL